MIIMSTNKAVDVAIATIIIGLLMMLQQEPPSLGHSSCGATTTTTIFVSALVVSPPIVAVRSNRHPSSWKTTATMKKTQNLNHPPCTLISMSSSSSQQAEQASSLSASQLKEERIQNARLLMTVDKTNWKEVVKLWTKDATYIEPSFQIQGEEELTYFLSNLFAEDFVQDDYKFDILDEVYEGEGESENNDEDCKYMCYWRMYGTFIKKFGPLITISEKFDAKGCSIMKFRSGEAKCYFHHDLYTEGDLWKNVVLIGNLVEYLRYLFRSKVTKNKK